MNSPEIITDPRIIEELFRKDQEAEDAPTKVQEILTNPLGMEKRKNATEL